MHQEWIIGYTERMEEGRSGKKIYADIPRKKPRKNQHDRLEWIGRKFIAPMTFTGGGQYRCIQCMKRTLLPKLPSGATVVMDHAALGKRSAKTKEFIESAGCHWLYLPTYALRISIPLSIAGIP